MARGHSQWAPFSARSVRAASRREEATGLRGSGGGRAVGVKPTSRGQALAEKWGQPGQVTRSAGRGFEHESPPVSSSGLPTVAWSLVTKEAAPVGIIRFLV